MAAGLEDRDEQDGAERHRHHGPPTTASHGRRPSGGRQEPHRVAAETGEGGAGQVDDAGRPELEVQPLADGHVHERHRRDERPVRGSRAGRQEGARRRARRRPRARPSGAGSGRARRRTPEPWHEPDGRGHGDADRAVDRDGGRTLRQERRHQQGEEGRLGEEDQITARGVGSRPSDPLDGLLAEDAARLDDHEDHDHREGHDVPELRAARDEARRRASGARRTASPPRIAP